MNSPSRPGVLVSARFDLRSLGAAQVSRCHLNIGRLGRSLSLFLEAGSSERAKAFWRSRYYKTVTL